MPPGTTSHERRALTRSEPLEALDVDDEDDRAADLDLEVFGHVEQPGLERRGIGHGDLGPAGEWTVHRGHQLLEDIEEEIRTALPASTLFTHLESLEDPASFADTDLDREEISFSGQGVP